MIRNMCAAPTNGEAKQAGSFADRRWMAAAQALAERAVARASPNPPVGCLIVAGDRIVGRGWTQPGGRPHAEAMALAQAGAQARGATAYVTLEPCAHSSARGPACADSLISAGIAHVVAGLTDPDPRTAGAGFRRLEAQGIKVTRGVGAASLRDQLRPHFLFHQEGRPLVSLKLALSLDGFLAMANGESRWITGEAARDHAHLERSRVDAVLIGRGTLEADNPQLSVRLAGLEDRSPLPVVASSSLKTLPENSFLSQNPRSLLINSRDPTTILHQLATKWVRHLLIEGGAGLAAAFVRADLVDRLLLYRAPILLGDGKSAVQSIGLHHLADSHGRWRGVESRPLGSDRLDIYARARQS